MPNLSPYARKLQDRIEEIPSFVSEVREEMEKDGYDLMEQVTILILGGVLGGQAFQVAQSDTSLLYELSVFTGLLLTGYATLAMLHFVVSMNRVSKRE